jgi:membrane protease YdiL (CAAX protease family)
MNRALLWIEFFVLFVLGPLALYAWATRGWIYASLWIAAAYALWQTTRSSGFSWGSLWQGDGWSAKNRKAALVRFAAAAILMTILTAVTLPTRLLSFPLERPVLWLAVMTLYPILSVIPQELLFRSFFIERYAVLFARPRLRILLSGLCFGLSHLILNNWVAPSFTAIGGVIFAYGYFQHRSLKWAVIEHSLYGCFVFTIGFGWFFYTGNWR